MFIEKLKENFKIDEPIFFSEIKALFPDYSRQRLYQFIANEEELGNLIRYDTGIYYMPEETELGPIPASIEDIIVKKYIQNKNEVFGIFGRNVIDLNFLVTYQVPNTLEVVTNNESRRYREINIGGFNVILRKSRTQITNENEKAYVIMELFNNLNMKRYMKNYSSQKLVSKYIQENKITLKEIMELSKVFPAKTTKHLLESGVLSEFL